MAQAGIPLRGTGETEPGHRKSYIVDGLERHARHLLKAEHIETAKKLFFLNDPPGDASPLICGCYQILRNIHCLRQAIALNDVRSAAYHAFYIGRERQRIIATRGKVSEKMQRSDQVMAGALSKQWPLAKLSKLHSTAQPLLDRGMRKRSLARLLAPKFSCSENTIRRYLDNLLTS